MNLSPVHPVDREYEIRFRDLDSGHRVDFDGGEPMDTIGKSTDRFEARSL